MRIPSASRIVEHFNGDPYFDVTLEDAERIRDALRPITKVSSLRKTEDALEKVGLIIGAFGVEVIHKGSEYDYPPNIRALYVNTGDTYSPTLAYVCYRNVWRLTCMGDLV